MRIDLKCTTTVNLFNCSAKDTGRAIDTVRRITKDAIEGIAILGPNWNTQFNDIFIGPWWQQFALGIAPIPQIAIATNLAVLQISSKGKGIGLFPFNIEFKGNIVIGKSDSFIRIERQWNIDDLIGQCAC